MSRFKDNLQMYWPALVGILLFVPTAWQYCSLGMWEEHISWAVAAVMGFVCMLAPDEVASWTGRYGWTYESFWSYPPTYIRFLGFCTQVYVLAFGF